jgi:hypothetical protein
MKLSDYNQMQTLYDRQCSSPIPEKEEIVCVSPNNQQLYANYHHNLHSNLNCSINNGMPHLSGDTANDLKEPNSNMLSIFILHSSQDFYISACLDETLIDNYLLTSIVKNNNFKPKTLHKIKLDVLFSSNITIRNGVGGAILPSSGASPSYSKSCANSDISKSSLATQRGQNAQYDNGKYDMNNYYNARSLADNNRHIECVEP